MEATPPSQSGHEEPWDVVDAPADAPTQDAAEETPDDAATYEGLVAALRTETDAGAKRAAAATLFRRAYYNAERGPLRDCGAFAALLAVVKTSDDHYCQLYALGGLMRIVATEDLEIDEVFESVRNIRAVTSDEWMQLQEVIDDTSRPENVRIEAVEIVECLLIVSAEGDERMASVVPKIVALLKSSHAQLSSTATRTLGRLVDHGDVAQDVMEGTVPLLTELLRDGEILQQERAAGTLSRILKKDTKRTARVLELLVGMLQSDVRGERIGAVMTIFEIVRDSEERQRAALDAGALTPLFHLLQSHNEDEQAAVILAIGELMDTEGTTAELIELQVDILSTGADMMQAFVLGMILKAVVEGDLATKVAYVNGGVIYALLKLLTADLPDARAQAAIALSLLVDEQDFFKYMVLAAGAAPLLVAMLRYDPEYDDKPFVTEDDLPKKAPPLRTLLYLANGNGLCKLRIAQAGALPEIVRIIRESHEHVEKAIAAAALAALTDGNDAYAIEAALLGVLEPLVALARKSAETRDLNGVDGALSALCTLSASKHNQDTILGLNIRGLLWEIENTTPATQNIANNIRRHQTQQPDICQIL